MLNPFRVSEELNGSWTGWASHFWFSYGTMTAWDHRLFWYAPMPIAF